MPATRCAVTGEAVAMQLTFGNCQCKSIYECRMPNVRWVTREELEKAFPSQSDDEVKREYDHEMTKCAAEFHEMAKGAADFQQRQGVAWDIVTEAIDAYDEWLLDDDYDATSALRKIINRMRERRALYREFR